MIPPDDDTLLQTRIEPALAVRLVLGVARLGEADLQGWWSSQGMNPAVGFALAGFRRTAAVVGAELALLSATRRHRQVLPRPTAVHLFSPHLPFAGWTRAHLAEQKTSNGRTLIHDLRAWKTVEAGRDQLVDWISALKSPPHEGDVVRPVDLGKSAVGAALLARFTQGYVTQHGELAVPYVDLAP